MLKVDFNPFVRWPSKLLYWCHLTAPINSLMLYCAVGDTDSAKQFGINHIVA